MEPLPDHIADLIRQGRKIEAIKALREATGASLAESKSAVERIAGSLQTPLAPEVVGTHTVPPDVEALARAGKTIEAIKLLRERTGMGLKEAKERVELIPGAQRVGNPAAVVIGVAILVLLLGILAAIIVGGAA